MNCSRAIILNENPTGAAVAACAARLSTRGGTALELFESAGDREKDAKLIGKVLSSGHKSVIEHHVFSIAFDQVSVFVEQFMIEARLASFTVKSRRYVDFTDAGYIMPDDLSPRATDVYRLYMEHCFKAYEGLTALGIPREDARFVLPYALRSNFYATINARELMQIICHMLKGRGRHFPELVMLGTQLKEQFDRLYPGLLDRELSRFAPPKEADHDAAFQPPKLTRAEAQLVSAPSDTNEVLRAALSFGRRFALGNAADIRELLCDPRARELEFLNYAFLIKNISLACLTHFSRHRMQSPIIPDVLDALKTGRHMLPPSIQSTEKARTIYEGVYQLQHVTICQLQQCILPTGYYPYLAVSGNTIDILISMNARELLHFALLRTCRRAQWEIRDVAKDMLRKLTAESMELFGLYGPSCAVKGFCPEGRMSCGKPMMVENGEWKDRE